MHAAVGRVADSADQSLQFAVQAVDFSQFISGALQSASAGAAVLCAAVLSLNF